MNESPKKMREKREIIKNSSPNTLKKFDDYKLGHVTSNIVWLNNFFFHFAYHMMMNDTFIGNSYTFSLRFSCDHKRMCINTHESLIHFFYTL